MTKQMVEVSSWSESNTRRSLWIEQEQEGEVA